MLVFSLLAKAVEKVERSRDELLENRFAQRGCSKTNMAERLELMERRGEEIRRKIDEQQRQAEESYRSANNRRCAEEASR
jgi:predicted ribosome quality control (RQC) complex YloA/Tae2 family protein